MNNDEHRIDPEDAVTAAIDAAEEIRDPLDGLVERAATDPGAAFAADVLERLAALKRNDLSAFEVLRAQLKGARCRVIALDQALAEGDRGMGGSESKQADILIRLAGEADLFHAAGCTGYADVNINGHRETKAIRSKGFKHWLAHRFYDETAGAPSPKHCNRRSTSPRQRRISTDRNGQSSSASVLTRGSSTLIWVMRLGGPWRSTTTAGG